MKIVDGTTYKDDTPQEVVEALERARNTGKRIRLFYGDSETGRDWQEEWSVTGTVGRSTGRLKIPLIIANRRSMGGPGILDDCIVRLYVDGREVYRHFKYNQPEYEILPYSRRHMPAPFRVLADGKLHARFKSRLAAERWVSFMRGERMGK
jgi:hypothetical protein